MSNLKNRVSELEGTVEALRKYIVMRDGLWIEKRLDDIEKHIFSYERVGDEDVRLQLEFDNLMMCRAHLQEDFLEYCRRAVLQMEGFLGWALAKHENDDVGRAQKAWKKVQRRQTEDRRNHSPKDYPSDIGKVGAFDKLEYGFTVFHKWNFFKLPEEEERFWKMKAILDIRNIASHRDDGTRVASQLKGEALSLYESEGRYQQVAGYLIDLQEWTHDYF
jgi:hypothetical protein